MLRKFRIHNFKCYSKSQDFELGVINFIYGNNSVGKSTFLQAVEKVIRSQENNGIVPRDKVTSFKNRGVSGDDVWLLRLTKKCAEGFKDVVWRLVKSNEGDNNDWCFVDDATGENVSPSEFSQYVPEYFDHVEANETGGLNSLDALEEELTQGQIDCVNGMFDELKIGYRCLNARELYDMVLDYGPLTVGQVGAGIRRIFKCAKSLAKWEGGILLLEEPETNVNEDQLAALTKVIVRRALELKLRGTDAQIVVECHSEHMLLKLLTLVVSQDDGLESSDVTVHYVEKTVDGSIVTRCRIDEYGEFDQWPSPNGFFRARNRIVFGDPS